MPPSPLPQITYQVLAYHLPRSPTANTLITCTTTLTSSSWSIDLHHAFPTGTPADIYFLRGTMVPLPPCFCGHQDTDPPEEATGESDQYWSCTAVCKLKRRYKNYMQKQQERGRTGGGGGVEYVLFVETDGDFGCEDIPLLERVSDEVGVPVWERGVVMVRVEEWVPVDVKPVIVDGLKIRDVWEDEMVHLKQFFKGICSDESAWEGRFPEEGGSEEEGGGRGGGGEGKENCKLKPEVPLIWKHEEALYGCF